jgi:hypothetical protein
MLAVVIGSRCRNADDNASVSSTAPATAIQATKLIWMT